MSLEDSNDEKLAALSIVMNAEFAELSDKDAVPHRSVPGFSQHLPYIATVREP